MSVISLPEQFLIPSFTCIKKSSIFTDVVEILGESNHHPPSSIAVKWHLGAQLILFVSMLTSVGIGILVFGKAVRQ